MNPETRDYVFGKKKAEDFVAFIVNYMKTFGDDYVAEGKEHLTIGIGCTGGFHRSVAMAERLGEALREAGYGVIVGHRDLGV